MKIIVLVSGVLILLAVFLGRASLAQEAGDHDLHELQALMAPRPFLVSGVQGGPDPKTEHTDKPLRWKAQKQVLAFFEYFLKHGK